MIWMLLVELVFNKSMKRMIISGCIPRSLMRIKSTMQSLVSDFMLETKGRAANLLAESRKNEYKK